MCYREEARTQRVRLACRLGRCFCSLREQSGPPDHRNPEGALGTLFLAGKPWGAVFFCVMGKGLEPYGFVSPAGSVVASALCESRVVHRTTATQKAHKKQQINGKNLHLHKWENMVISNRKIFFPLIGGGKL